MENRSSEHAPGSRANSTTKHKTQSFWLLLIMKFQSTCPVFTYIYMCRLYISTMQLLFPQFCVLRKDLALLCLSMFCVSSYMIVHVDVCHAFSSHFKAIASDLDGVHVVTKRAR